MRRLTTVVLVMVASSVTGCGEGAPDLTAKTGERATVVTEAKGGTRGGLVGGQSKVATMDADVPVPVGRTFGVVKWWNESRGFGFIETAVGDVRVERAQVDPSGGVPLLQEGEAVEFSIALGDKGRVAVNVVRLG